MANNVNPFHQIRGLLPERVDQGVDFSGSGNIVALNDGIVIENNGPGWPGGPFMSYRLTGGPDAGRTVFVAENITPTVGPGQKVRAGQVIATMHGGIETGWADSTGTRPLSQTAAAGSISGANLPPGGTLVGLNFESLLRSLGAPGAPNVGQQSGGRLPPGLGSTGTLPPVSPGTPAPGVSLAGFGSLTSAFTGILSAFTGIAQDIHTLIHGDPAKGLGGLLWLFNPAHWIRIISFIAALALLVLGIKFLREAGKGDASLAVGILLITGAGILAFLAFHNIPDDIKSLQDLLSWLSTGIREGKIPA